jgi:hypothetical protein
MPNAAVQGFLGARSFLYRIAKDTELIARNSRSAKESELSHLSRDGKNSLFIWRKSWIFLVCFCVDLVDF